MWRRSSWAISVVALVLLAAEAAPSRAQTLRLDQPAPEITGSPWINSAPLTLQGLRGRVVLVEFWTYG